MPTTVLCTGGVGFIGIHTAIQLIAAGFDVVLLDNLSNSKKSSVERLEHLTQRSITFIEADIRDATALQKVFDDNPIQAVIHYAAFKAVGESCEKPMEYYDNNLMGIITLLNVMKEKNVKTFVFSSSCTVYEPTEAKLTEECPLKAYSPYGHTKIMSEQILQDLFQADASWRISILRYFNPVGADESGLLGESPDIPLNLLPTIQQIAVGRRERLNVYGGDWKTVDGTGVRDYLHVTDLAKGHIAALEKLMSSTEGQCMIHNLGTGKGVSVLELIKVFENVTGKQIPFSIVERRAGDVAHAVCDPTKANKELNWKTEKTLEDMCATAWKWQSLNPLGYSTSLESALSLKKTINPCCGEENDVKRVKVQDSENSIPSVCN